MNEPTERERYLNDLHAKVEKGRLLEGVELHGGFKTILEELEKMTEALRWQAVSKDSIGNPTEHAALVGAHNALNSLLTMMQATKKTGEVAAKALETAKKEDKELDRLGIQTRI